MIIVVDAALVVSALIQTGPVGEWSEEQLLSHELAAPHLMPVEVSNILRRAAIVGDISSDVASLAHEDLLALNTDLFPYHPFADRVWELRSNVTTYDAWHVALAESLGSPLATLDHRLSRSPGCACPFLTPP